MLAIAVAVKLDTPGPALFRQTRIGRGNQLFEMLKFRSMRDADHAANAVGRARRRPDHARSARFIRRTSIDELPQLLNVSRGR